MYAHTCKYRTACACRESLPWYVWKPCWALRAGRDTLLTCRWWWSSKATTVCIVTPLWWPQIVQPSSLFTQFVMWGRLWVEIKHYSMHVYAGRLVYPSLCWHPAFCVTLFNHTSKIVSLTGITVNLFWYRNWLCMLFFRAQWPFLTNTFILILKVFSNNWILDSIF